MDNQNVPIRNWNSSFASTSTSIRQNRAPYLPLAEFVCTTGPMRLHGSRRFTSSWGTTLALIGSIDPPLCLRCNYALPSSNRQDCAPKKPWQGTSIMGQTQDTPMFHVGDQVWLEGRHLRTNQQTAKLAPDDMAPFVSIR